MWRLRRSWISIAAGCLAVSLAASALVLGSDPTGAAVVGWPLLWSILLFPFRVVGVLDDDVAFAVGLLLSLAANARDGRRDGLHRVALDGEPVRSAWRRRRSSRSGRC